MVPENENEQAVSVVSGDSRPDFDYQRMERAELDDAHNRDCDGAGGRYGNSGKD